MTPRHEHTSEGGRDDRGVPYHAESALSSAQVLNLKHTGIKKPRETGDFRDPTSARRNARPEKGHIPSAHRQKRHRQDSPMSCTLRPSAVRAHSHIELEPFPSAHRISNHCLSLSSPKPLARKSILFSALALATPLPRSASAIAFPWAPSSPILFLQTRERVVSTLLKNAKSKTQKRNRATLDRRQPRDNPVLTSRTPPCAVRSQNLPLTSRARTLPARSPHIVNRSFLPSSPKLRSMFFSTPLTARAPPIAFAPSSPISFSPRTRFFSTPLTGAERRPAPWHPRR